MSRHAFIRQDWNNYNRQHGLFRTEHLAVSRRATAKGIRRQMETVYPDLEQGEEIFDILAVSAG